MKLIVILIALGLQWYFGIRYTLKDYDWFTPYTGFLKDKLGSTGLWTGYIGLAVIVLPLLLLVLIIYSIFDDVLFNLFGYAISVAVVWYCVDARNLEELLHSYFSGNKAEKEVEEYVDAALPKTKAGIARKVSSTILLRSLHTLFSVVFWYLILGVVGVTLYFFVSLIAQQLKDFKDEAKLVQGVLDWVPVRLVGLSFAFMGSFGAVFVYWMKNIVTGIEKAEELITHYGLTAIGANPRESKESDHKESKETAELVFRAVIVWLVLLTAVTLASLF